METWDFLDDGAGGAAENMAVDEALLLTAAERPHPLLRRYRWSKPSVSFGYFQRYPEELSKTHALVRRPTGGGIVYHGEDTTYTVVVPAGHRLFAMSTAHAYCALHRAVAAACQLAQAAEAVLHDSALLSPRGQYECFQKPVSGDVVAEGKKLAGGAQRRRKNGMLHQGSVAAPIDARTLQRGFENELGIQFVPAAISAPVRDQAARLAREKYGTEAWNRRIS